MDKIKNILRNKFFTGLFLVLPLILTFYIVYFVLNFVGKTFSPLISHFLRSYFFPAPQLLVTLISVILMLFFIWLTGFIAVSVSGRFFIKQTESLLLYIPFIRGIYSSTKKLTGFFSPGKDDFKRVVFVKFPHSKSYALGFITNEKKWQTKIDNKFGENLVNVFVPTGPNPTSGFLLLVPEKEVSYPPFSVDEAFRMIVSGGILLPDKILLDGKQND
ncbi:MAG: DUF502 domain-containing protein [Elusimicrobiota bacterium]